MEEFSQFIQHITDTFTREEIPAKHLLIKEGALAKKIFFIESGCCRCWFNTDDGKEVTMSFGFEGDFASSMETIISNEPSWYNVETLEPMVVYSILISEFKEKIATIAAYQLSYCRFVEKRLLHYQKLFVSRIRDSPEKRYRELLAQHPEIIRRVPQHYIASFLGITSVSLSRIRNRR
jgi:CRP-like cAMP-binding protein